MGGFHVRRTEPFIEEICFIYSRIVRVVNHIECSKCTWDCYMNFLWRCMTVIDVRRLRHRLKGGNQKSRNGCGEGYKEGVGWRSMKQQIGVRLGWDELSHHQSRERHTKPKKHHLGGIERRDDRKRATEKKQTFYQNHFRLRRVSWKSLYCLSTAFGAIRTSAYSSPMLKYTDRQRLKGIREW